MGIFKKLIVSILTWEARMVLARHVPRVVAISGSVGKTATKDAIFATLSSRVHVRKSEKSMNSEFGVPLAILGLGSGWHNPFTWLRTIVVGLYTAVLGGMYPKWLVLEVGADRPGDIRTIAKWLRPDIVVLTHVPEIPVHVEFFKSPEDVVSEKRSLVEYLRPGGTLVVNGDDLLLKDGLTQYNGTRITFGLESFNDFFATDIEIEYESGDPTGMKFELHHGSFSLPVTVHGALGLPRVYAALAALAVAKIAGVSMEDAARALTKWEPPPGRMRILKGIKGSIIFDDTYNSSPAAVFAALDTLSDILAKRKIAVLGDMLELGKYSADSHKQVGMRAAKCVDILWTVGIRSRTTGEAALDAGMKDKNVREYEFGESRRAGKELESILKSGDVVLIKGSQSMRMERAVLEIMVEPERSLELLVRQDPEWLSRE
ncbi:MAG: UDP-N-acetylmuramoyl-tripeptide--D-alanyl-D-alanine ligase [bacterium]|nr:UDP-N-acetylmuramoyl-tripeptide--D-alanyl-D-alanine ligase [bacterium]